MSSAENAVLRQLVRAWKKMLPLISQWNCSLSSTTSLDSIANQLEQRHSVIKSCLFTRGCPYAALSNPRNKLLAKLDEHITLLCEQVRKDLNGLEVIVEKMRSLYISVGNTCEKYRESLYSDGAEMLRRRSEARPSLGELCSWLDEVYLNYKHDLERKQTNFVAFEPRNESAFQSLRHSWIVPYKWQRRLNEDILIFVVPFVEFHHDL